jgi:hypothetical protein
MVPAGRGPGKHHRARDPHPRRPQRRDPVAQGAAGGEDIVHHDRLVWQRRTGPYGESAPCVQTCQAPEPALRGSAFAQNILSYAAAQECDAPYKLDRLIESANVPAPARRRQWHEDRAGRDMARKHRRERIEIRAFTALHRNDRLAHISVVGPNRNARDTRNVKVHRVSFRRPAGRA